MSYLISKLVFNRYKYFARFSKSKVNGWSLSWEGLKQNATTFGEKSMAQDYLDMAIAETNGNDYSLLEIIKI